MKEATKQWRETVSLPEAVEMAEMNGVKASQAELKRIAGGGSVIAVDRLKEWISTERDAQAFIDEADARMGHPDNALGGMLRRLYDVKRCGIWRRASGPGPVWFAAAEVKPHGYPRYELVVVTWDDESASAPLSADGLYEVAKVAAAKIADGRCRMTRDGMAAANRGAGQL